MPTISDPRVFFAAERTLLAWIRTGITVMGLGFVVARFGLFLGLLTARVPGTDPTVHWHSNVLGIALVLLGSGAVAGALQNYRHFLRSLPSVDRPAAAIPALTLSVALVIAVVGLLLAAYLAAS